MAQRQQNIVLKAPGFEGINTEDSPYGMPEQFCLSANNAIVDKNGRLGTREAFAEHTTVDNVSYSANGSMATETKIIHQIGSGIINNTMVVIGVLEHLQYDSNAALLQSDYYIVESVENGSDFEMNSLSYPTLADDSKLITADIVNFNEKLYIFSSGNIALQFDGTTITDLFAGTQNVDYINPQDDTGDIATDIDGDVALAAFGRLWVAGVNGDYNTIYYSDLLIADQWYDGKAAPTDSQNTGGIIDVSEYWPSGGDRIVALAAHNNFLIVFGRQSILLYSGAQGDPAATDGLALVDTVKNMGAVSREAVENIGSDVLFVDDSGVRSFGRTIQEKSVPIGDLTRNVRFDISEVIRSEDKTSISLKYLPHKDIIVVLFADTQQAFVLDKRMPSSTGGWKVTRWTGCTFRCIHYTEFGGDAIGYLGSSDEAGFCKYDGYLQYDLADYEFSYTSPVLNLGDTTALKIPKRIDVTLVSRTITQEGTTQWGFGDTLDRSSTYDVDAEPPALYNVAEFNSDLFGEGLFTVRRYKINTNGSGQVIRVGHKNVINGNGFSLQEINVQLLLGRIN